MKNSQHNNPFNSSEHFDDEEIYRSLRSEKEYMTPPPQVRASLIKSVRLINKASGNSGALSGIIRKAGIPLAAGIAMYFSVIYMNNNNEPPTSIADINTMPVATANSTSNLVVAPIVSSIETIPTNSSSENQHNSNSINGSISNYLAQNTNTINRNKSDINYDSNKPVSVDKVLNTQLDNILSSAGIASSNLIDELNYSNISAESYSPNRPQVGRISLANLLNSSNIASRAGDKYMISVRSMAGTTFADNYNTTSSIANSFALGVYKSISGSDNLLIGLEFGREPYQKKFFNKYEPNQIEYVDNPNTIWGGVGIKYQITEWNIAGLAITPFSSLLLGAGEIGPMGRFNIGIDQQITNRVSVTIGAEMSTMLYNNKVQWYSSNKFGITAGINYQL